MIKSIDRVRLKHLDKMERTGKVRQLLAWWNILPVFLFKKRLILLVEDIYKQINEGKNNDATFDELEIMEWKIRSILKIHGLETCILIVLKDLELSIKFDHLIKRFKLTRGQRRKIKEVDLSLLGKAIQKIEVYTGIKINGIENIIDVQKELIWLKNKFEQNFNEKPKPIDENQKKSGIMDFAGGYVLYGGGTFTGLGEMTIPELLTLKNNATERYESEKRQLNNIDHGE